MIYKIYEPFTNETPSTTMASVEEQTSITPEVTPQQTPEILTTTTSAPTTTTTTSAPTTTTSAPTTITSAPTTAAPTTTTAVPTTTPPPQQLPPTTTPRTIPEVDWIKFLKFMAVIVVSFFIAYILALGFNKLYTKYQ
jgi:hypothetical protein